MNCLVYIPEIASSWFLQRLLTKERHRPFIVVNKYLCFPIVANHLCSLWCILYSFLTFKETFHFIVHTEVRWNMNVSMYYCVSFFTSYKRDCHSVHWRSLGPPFNDFPREMKDIVTGKARIFSLLLVCKFWSLCEKIHFMSWSSTDVCCSSVMISGVKISSQDFEGNAGINW